MENLDVLKRRAAEVAVTHVQDGQIVGLGTGSTAKHVVLLLGERVRAGLKITGVPTSEATAELARQSGISLLETDDAWAIDLAIDGADQVDSRLNLIKGGGGALLREKIVAAAAARLIIVADYTKCVPVLGHPVPLPIEVVPFGWGSTARQIQQVGGKVVLREQKGRAFRTEGGHYILDLYLDRIGDPTALEVLLSGIPGVVGTGLFVGRTETLIVGTPQGVDVRQRASTGTKPGRG